MLLPKIASTRVPKRPRALSPEQVIELRHAYGDGVPVRVLAERFGVGKSVAHDIATGRRYADVVTPARIPFVQPTIRERGYHSEDECRQLGAMLRQHPNQWVQVKKNRTKPNAQRYASFGMDTSIIQLGSEWGLFVRWKLVPQVTITAIAG